MNGPMFRFRCRDKGTLLMLSDKMCAARRGLTKQERLDADIKISLEKCRDCPGPIALDPPIPAHGGGEARADRPPTVKRPERAPNHRPTLILALTGLLDARREILELALKREDRRGVYRAARDLADLADALCALIFSR